MNDHEFPPGYSVEHLTELPSNLAMTELGVRPCVAFLKTPAPSESNKSPDAARDILPKLDAREVAAVFTANFRNFLFEKDLDERDREEFGDGDWYKGSWHSWHESAWRMHQFFVPVRRGEVFLAKRPESYTAARSPEEKASVAKTPAPASATTKSKDPATSKDSRSTLQPPLPRKFYTTTTNPLEQQSRYRVFGMTARILVDAARVAYGQEPEYEHNSHFGDEDMIAKLMSIGRLSAIKKEGEVLTREVMREAGKAKI